MGVSFRSTSRGIFMSASSLPSPQAARDCVTGYVYEQGFNMRLETTWLDKWGCSDA